MTKLLSESDSTEVRKVGLNFHGLYRDDSWTYFVMDFAKGGDLFGLMQSWEHAGFDLQKGREERAWPLIHALLRRVAVLHSMGIAHRDISLENVMLLEKEDESADAAESLRLIDY